jgi:hypothetical protein
MAVFEVDRFKQRSTDDLHDGARDLLAQAVASDR